MRFPFVVCALCVLFLVEAQAQPSISLSHTSYDFGPVGVGLSSTWDFIVSNSGDEALACSSVTSSLPEFTISSPSFPKTVSPGESLTVSVAFRPSVLGVFTDTIMIASNDPLEGLSAISVRGQGVAVVNVSVPDTSVPAGAQLFLPVTVDDVSGLDVTRVEMRCVFDRRVLSAHGASNIGTIAQFWDLTVDAHEDQIRIEMAGPVPPAPPPPLLSGSGVLVYIDFSISEEAQSGQSTPVIVTDVTFNDGVPVGIPHDGMITVAAYTIAGEVVYYKHATPVDGALMSLEGGVEESVSSGADGSYRFDGIPGGREYTVTPSKSGEVRPAINSYDAALVLRYIVDQVSLDSLQLVAADVTGRDGITSYDVSNILRFRVGKIDRFPIDREWLFIPAATEYDFLSSDALDEDYTALVYGDVSGNWPGSQARKAPVSTDLPRLVFPDGAPVVRGGTVSVPLLIEGAEGVASADVRVAYDAETLHLSRVETTPFSSGFVLQFSDEGGVAIIAMAGPRDLHGTGELFQVSFRVLSPAGWRDGIPLEVSAIVNEGIVAADRLRGMVTFRSATAPKGCFLGQNHPNPFNSSTAIHYTVSLPEWETLSAQQRSCRVSLAVYNILGQKVRGLVDRFQEPGAYSVVWDGRDERGDEVPSGVYSYRLTAGSFASARTMALLR